MTYLSHFIDECGSIPIVDAIFLRPKCYSILKADGSLSKRAKGVQRVVVRNVITHADYADVFSTGSSKEVDVRGFKSRNHQVFTYEVTKKSLSLFEDKRRWNNENESYAYGHWRTRIEDQSIPPIKKSRFELENLQFTS